jgi:hypothetical protein
MGQVRFEPGDWVIFRKTKFSQRPGPRARHVAPATRGEEYSYVVDKFWIVRAVRDDGALELVTRKGKLHAMSPDDPRLRPLRWWERWTYRRRFEAIEEHLRQFGNSPPDDSRTETPE